MGLALELEARSMAIQWLTLILLIIQDVTLIHRRVEMSWRSKCKSEAAKVSVEKKREFLKLLHDGKSLGDARTFVGDISFNAACGIINNNIKSALYLCSAEEVK